MLDQIKALKHICIMTVCAVITISCAATPTSSPARTTSPAPSTPTQQLSGASSRRNIYMAHLREEGYLPNFDESTGITFKWEGTTYHIFISEEDPSFFYILLPGIRNIDSDENMIRAAYAVSQANARTKLAKAFIVNSQNGLWVSIGAEMFLENPEHFALFFKVMMNTIITAKRYFDTYF